MLESKGMKSGDTLVEVCIAIAIFSLVITGVVSVVNSAISGSQSVLENTITRAEIDAQAEALRFIHSSYVAAGESNNDSGGDKFKLLWGAIASIADKNVGNLSSALLTYKPSTCSQLYEEDSDDSIFKQNAFILDTYWLSSAVESEITTDIVIEAAENKDKFSQASTYPRLLRSGQDKLMGLYESYKGNDIRISKAEGLFIIPVKDPGITNIVKKNGTVAQVAAYYDFYIRSCWYAPGAKQPTTISTNVRLYNPEIKF